MWPYELESYMLVLIWFFYWEYTYNETWDPKTKNKNQLMNIITNNRDKWKVIFTLQIHFSSRDIYAFQSLEFYLHVYPKHTLVEFHSFLFYNNNNDKKCLTIICEYIWMIPFSLKNYTILGPPKHQNSSLLFFILIKKY